MSMLTVTPDSAPRQPICRLTISRTPHSACRFICVCRVVPVCVLWDLPWNVVPRSGHACEAPRVVLRGFVDLPLFAQGQHYVFYLSFTTGGGGSVSLITALLLAAALSKPTLVTAPTAVSWVGSRRMRSCAASLLAAALSKPTLVTAPPAVSLCCLRGRKRGAPFGCWAKMRFFLAGDVARGRSGGQAHLLERGSLHFSCRIPHRDFLATSPAKANLCAASPYRSWALKLVHVKENVGQERCGSDVCPRPSGAASRWDQWGRLRDRVEVGCHDEGWGGIEQEEAHPSPPDSRMWLLPKIYAKTSYVLVSLHYLTIDAIQWTCSVLGRLDVDRGPRTFSLFAEMCTVRLKGVD